MKFNQGLERYIDSIQGDLESIEEKRKEILHSLSEYIRTSSSPKLNFICTHNSRRSHLCQVWAHVVAAYFDISVETFSGGTEATAFHPNAINALERAGFEIESSGGENPLYQIRFSETQDSIECFSKKYDDNINPQTGFAAVMTCSEADQECPVVFGAAERIKLLYEDPKVADGTAIETEKYDERCKQIAIEMFYVFSKINNRS